MAAPARSCGRRSFAFCGISCEFCPAAVSAWPKLGAGYKGGGSGSCGRLRSGVLGRAGGGAGRAAVRELRGASVPLGAVFPVAGLVLADGPVEQAGGLLGRLAEWVLTSAHERAVGSMVRAQGVLDTVTAGKMAAVAASAAA